MSEAELIYDAEFFRRQSAGSRRAAHVVLKLVFSWLGPRRVADVGCGVGTWLAAAKELGAGLILGVDGAHVDRTGLQIPAESFVEVDLENEAISTAVAADQRFDLVICMEVAEHLSYRRAPSFVRELISLGDVVLFSAAVPYQAGTHHINEQWPEFWAILFEAEGYVCLDIIRDRVWYNGEVEWWYRQNALLFVRRGSESHDRIVAAVVGETTRPALSRVHTENLLFQVLNTFRTHRASAREEEVEDTRSILSAYAEGTVALPPSTAVARADRRPSADDVFPRTRTIVSEPERDKAWLQERLRAAEAAHLTLTEDLAATRALLQERGAQLEVTRSLLDERQVQLDQTRGLLYTRWDELETTRALLGERQDHLDETLQLLHDRQLSLDEAVCQLELTRADLDERGAMLHAANRCLVERSDELDAARQAVADRTRQADHLAEVLRQREAILAMLHARNAQQAQELDVVRSEVAVLRSNLHRIPRLLRGFLGVRVGA